MSSLHKAVFQTEAVLVFPRISGGGGLRVSGGRSCVQAAALAEPHSAAELEGAEESHTRLFAVQTVTATAYVVTMRDAGRVMRSMIMNEMGYSVMHYEVRRHMQGPPPLLQ